MVFSSYTFVFLFLPIVLVGYELVSERNHRRGILWLLGMSLIFYACWNVQDLAWLAGSLVLNFAAGNLLLHSQRAGLRRWVLLLAVVANLTLLIAFKYSAFLIALLRGEGMSYSFDSRLALPLGISFYSFQQLGFLIEAHRKTIQKSSFIDYALFVTFYPHLIAGPIMAYQDLVEQIRTHRYRPFSQRMVAGGAFFLSGLVKKILIADYLAGYATAAFGSTPPQFLVAWIGILAYSLQLYFDFSGYSDMAVGLGKMLGFNLLHNFNSPLAATSIIEHWRRWHITLTGFFRQYVYFPLGGSRRGFLRKYFNAFVVMFISAIWHGSGMTYVLWGVMLGGALVGNMILRDNWERLRLPPVPHWVSIPTVFLFTCMDRVMFHSHSVASAKTYYLTLFGLRGFGWDAPYPKLWACLIIATFLLCVWFLPNSQSLLSRLEQGWRTATARLWGIGAALVFGCCVVFFSRFTEFIYFQF